MAAIKGIARLRVMASSAKPSPAIGQALGPLGVNMVEFCKQFNDASNPFVETAPMRVHLTAFQDRTFSFKVLSPPTSWFLKKAAGIEKGASQPGRETVGEVSIRAIYEIAQTKVKYDEHLQSQPLPGLVRSICATAKSMGLKVVR